MNTAATTQQTHNNIVPISSLRITAVSAANHLIAQVTQLEEAVRDSVPASTSTETYQAVRDKARTVAAKLISELDATPGVSLTVGTVDDESYVFLITGSHGWEIALELFDGDRSWHSGHTPSGRWSPVLRMTDNETSLRYLAETSFAAEALASDQRPVPWEYLAEAFNLAVGPRGNCTRWFD